jgi:hypothetical protein
MKLAHPVAVRRQCQVGAYVANLTPLKIISFPAIAQEDAAECALRGIAVGRKNWLFAGSDQGGHRAATVYSLVETAKLNKVDPEAWLCDTIARIGDHPQRRIDELLPWNYRPA